MEKSVIVGENDARRSEAEASIRQIYFETYFAKPAKFPRKLLVKYRQNGELLCAAGLRTPDDGFFSECYLDQSIEQALATKIGRTVNRSDICEVTALVSKSPHETGAFIDDIVAQIATLGFRWSFYTLTSRLALLLKRKGLSPIDLAPAEARCVPSPEAWGRYYLTSPRVFAVSIEHLRARMPSSGDPLGHAIAI